MLSESESIDSLSYLSTPSLPNSIFARKNNIKHSLYPVACHVVCEVFVVASLRSDGISGVNCKPTRNCVRHKKTLPLCKVFQTLQTLRINTNEKRTRQFQYKRTMYSMCTEKLYFSVILLNPISAGALL